MIDDNEMGRFSVEFAVANYGEVVHLPRGYSHNANSILTEIE